MTEPTEATPATSSGYKSPTNKQGETTVPIVIHPPQRIVPAIGNISQAQKSF